MNLSILKRLSQPTPQFWVRVQIVCLVLSVIMGYVINAHLISTQVGWILVGWFGGGAAFAQLAVKDPDLLTDAMNNPLSILDKLGELQNDVQTVKTAVTDHIPATISDVNTAIAESNSLASVQPAASVTINNGAGADNTIIAQAPTDEDLKAAKAILDAAAKIKDSAPIV